MKSTAARSLQPEVGQNKSLVFAVLNSLFTLTP
jgi:hypothetical protein